MEPARKKDSIGTELDIDLSSTVNLPYQTACPLPDSGLSKESFATNIRMPVFQVNNPESPLLRDFVKTITKNFKPGEVEEYGTFKRELSLSNSESIPAKFIFVAAGDPLTDDKTRIISGAYGSLQGETVAVRLAYTDPSWRATGISQEVNSIFVDTAREESASRGSKVKIMVGECVDKSETYWNSLGMKRLFFADSGKEFSYFMAPTSWNRDGTPKSDCINEHLQIALLDNPAAKSIKTTDVRSAITELYNAWYIRPREDFNSNAAHKLHLDTVNTHLKSILAPLEGKEVLDLKTKEERENPPGFFRGIVRRIKGDYQYVKENGGIKDPPDGSNPDLCRGILAGRLVAACIVSEVAAVVAAPFANMAVQYLSGNAYKGILGGVAADYVAAVSAFGAAWTYTNREYYFGGEGSFWKKRLWQGIGQIAKDMWPFQAYCAAMAVPLYCITAGIGSGIVFAVSKFAPALANNFPTAVYVSPIAIILGEGIWAGMVAPFIAKYPKRILPNYVKAMDRHKH
jgi:hypothetical protein